MEINKEEYKDYLNEEYLGVHEAADLLGVTEEELWSLIKKHEIPSHNVAGAFTRFKRQEIELVKNKWRIERELFPQNELDFSHHVVAPKITFAQKFADFWYFNDFYIVCSVIIAGLLYFILSS